MSDPIEEIYALRRRIAALDRMADEYAQRPVYREEDLTPEFQEKHHDEVMTAAASGRILRRGQDAPAGARIAEPQKRSTLTRLQIEAMSPDEHERRRGEVMAYLTQHSED